MKKKLIIKYFEEIKLIQENVEIEIIEKIANILFKKITKKKKIFVAGNGGSAAIANHFFADFTKTIFIKSKQGTLSRSFLVFIKLGYFFRK